VKVRRGGRITFPAKLRKRFGMKEGSKLIAEETEKGLLLRVVPNLLDVAGIDSAYATSEEMKIKLDKLREEN
jgi:AbrB family looped-hinge helix DNA binding protein